MRSKWSVVDALFGLGGSLICIGLGMLLGFEAGLIAAGVFSIICAVLVDRSGGGRGREEGGTE